jgi:hypothetical protein
MIKAEPLLQRELKTFRLDVDLVVVGGGLSGACCAITAARAGLKVVLVQDRPVLGGNASSEVRLWVLGATSHMGNNNRWAREGGVIDELLVENMYRNPEGNPLIFDTIILEKVVEEKNVRLLLNTAVFEVHKDNDAISSLRAFCSQNSTMYDLVAPLFCDASGDGIVGFQAGAAFRMGAESMEEFGEKFAPNAEYGELLGHSIYFYTKDLGKPVRFVPPSYALEDITKIPRYKSFNAKEQGCKLWWIEYGGRLDTVHETETIKWELWKVVYGVWNYIKNSGNFPEAGTMTLEWVGTIPGKRESRRFEGDYMLTQQDIIEQRTHFDAVAFGGWSIDLHPADGVFSEKSPCNQWHSKGVFQIPYRSLYSKNVKNLFFAGRLISVSHVAFGSTRVMGTGAYVGQAVGIAASICLKNNLLPKEIVELPATTPLSRERLMLAKLQNELMKIGQHIPHEALQDTTDLVQKAEISASSELILKELPPDGEWFTLRDSVAQMLPIRKGKVSEISTWVNALESTNLIVELRQSSKYFNHTPDMILERLEITLLAGTQEIALPFQSDIDRERYVFVCFLKNEHIQLKYSQLRVSGVLSLFNKTNPAVSNYGKQNPTEDIGMEAFEFWCPDRRPKGQNVAMKITNGIALFGVQNLTNGVHRPTHQPNAWVTDLADSKPTLSLQWTEKQEIKKIVLCFDNDFDHPMETVLMTHPETLMPFCVRDLLICNDKKERIAQIKDNHQSQREIVFENPFFTNALHIHLSHPLANVPAGLMGVRVYRV